MTALQPLILCDLPNLASLPDWLRNLGLLDELKISMCPKLRCLPKSIQCLTALKSLKIYGCSELEIHCKESTGEKIAHIQWIVVENARMFYGGGGSSYTLDYFSHCYSCFFP
uniref:Disease resistance protein RGA4 n=1 Tax=Cicer arietinum TaxID=3827 RepID=A0A3Q7Y8J5_CICAR|nr:putative disease resistance protein RGA4 [Cicer arietinum]